MKLTAEVLDVIRNLLQQRKPNCKTIKYVDLTDYAPETLPKQIVALLPNVMIWDPLFRYSQELYCPHCHQDEDIRNVVRKSTWCVRGKQSPRMLWDRAWWCALVGKFYSCNKGHHVVSYHVGFLKQLPSQIVPFLLTHAAGMTTACYDFAIKLFEQGHSFKDIEQIMQGMFADEYERKRFLFGSQILPDLEGNMVSSPTDQIIRHHFLNQFDLNKDIYQSQMDRIPFTQLHVVTNGQRFNVNIGVKERLSVGPNTYKWNKLFESMFMIFNEFGCIKAYGLTKDVCIDQIIQCLVALAPFNPETETISMSNYCCVSRDSITEAFPNASVVFDLDFAKDLLKEMINCKDEKHEIFKDLDNVFKTNLVTQNANQLQMVSNMNTFYSKWSKEEYGAMVSEPFVDVMDNILLHVRNGCVPAKGEELNKEKTKRIFDLLSKVFQPLFLGVQSACGMVAHMVYVYNCQKLGNMKNKPIWSHQPLENMELVEFPKGIESEQELATEIIENSPEANNAIDESQEAQNQQVSQDETTATIETPEVEDPVTEEVVHGIEIENFSEKCQRFIPLGRLFFNIREIVFKLPVSHHHKSMRKFVSLMSEVWFNHDYLKISSLYNVVPKESLFALKILGLKEISPASGHLLNTSSLILGIYCILKELCVNKKLSYKMFATNQKSFEMLVTEKGITFGEAEEQAVNLDTLSKILSKEMIGGDETAYNNLFVESKKRIKPKQQSDLKKVKAEVDLATIYAAANVFGLPIMLAPTCKEIPILPIIPISKLEVCQPSFLVYDTESGFFYTFFKDNSEQKFFPCLCGSKSARQRGRKKQCIMVTCSCFSSGRSCTSLCKCFKCSNNKPEMDEQEAAATASNEPGEPKKKKKRCRDYDFHRSTPIPNHLPPTMLAEATSADTHINDVISPEIMHHAFLDAFMFALLTEGSMIRSEDLPDVLHGMFLEIRNEIVIDPMSREDEFLQYLAEIDLDFIMKWMTENKQQRKLMRDFKQLCSLSSQQPVVTETPKSNEEILAASTTKESPQVSAGECPPIDSESENQDIEATPLAESGENTTEVVVIIEHLDEDIESEKSETQQLQENLQNQIEPAHKKLVETHQEEPNDKESTLKSVAEKKRPKRETRKRK